MIRVKVFIVFYQRTITIALPDDVQPVEQLIPALRRRLNLPWREYTLSLPGKDEPIPKKTTLRELGIRNDDTLFFDVIRENPDEEAQEAIPQDSQETTQEDIVIKKGFPLWLSILLLLILVAICVSVLLFLRTWDIYS